MKVGDYLNMNIVRELILDQLVGWAPCGGTCSPGFKSSIWHGCLYFPGFILGFNGAMLLVVDDVPVDSEAPVVTL